MLIPLLVDKFRLADLANSAKKFTVLYLEF